MDQASGDFSIEQSRTMLAPARRLSLPSNERRHSFRVRVPGRASIWRKNQLQGHYAIDDICLGGCSLRGGPSCAMGERVEVVLHLPDCPPLWLSAEVRRSQGGAMALRFDRPPARVEDRLQDLVVESYTRMNADSEGLSLVVEPRSAIRRALVESLEAAGEHAVGVATPLDAVQLLLERGDHIRMAFVGAERGAAPSFELLEFLARQYPRVRRVLMGPAHEAAASWRAEATGEVHAYLELPHQDDKLRRLVHRVSALPSEALS